PIVNLGVGAGYAYDIMGPTHHTVEDISIMRALPNMVIYSPADAPTAAALARISYKNPSPQYIRFDRAGLPDLYNGQAINVKEGIIHIRKGKHLNIIATGIMVHQALKVADRLEKNGISVGLIDLCRLKPINQRLLFEYLKDVERIVTLEEHLLAGGMGSAIVEILVDAGVYKPTLRIGQDDRFVFDLGGREVIWEKYGLDVEGITNRISNWLND
ncbi:MAG: transketolase C-terminal domain-containing protein, partial [bacterium]